MIFLLQLFLNFQKHKLFFHFVELRCAILEKKLSLFSSITITRQYLAECVIVLISDYRGQLPFLIFFIFCVVGSHQ